jgi:hypothetical protein
MFRKQFSTVLSSVFILAVLLIPADAQSSNKGQYEVSENGIKVATVKASFDGDVVSAAIFRSGQPVHLYRAYPEVAAIKVQIGNQKIFTYYIETRIAEAKDFAFSIREVPSEARQQRSEVATIRRQLLDDMRILRAVRGYDAAAHVKLAELAFVNLTGDSSIYEGQPLASLKVTEVSQTSMKSNSSAAKFVRATAKVQGPPTNSLDGCLNTCSSQRATCVGTPGANKDACFANETSCTNNCYQVYGGGGGSDKQPIQP